MASQLSWLDSSLAEQQQIRELLGLFREQESRDELGIGQVRDAFGDLLFPGTSTLHTRARYLLIVPWCIRYAARRPGRERAALLDRTERVVIESLRAAGATDGLIGRRASTGVKTLPSTIYASALDRYGIDGGDEPVPASDEPEAEELTDLRADRWPPNLPPVPKGFPDAIDGGLELRPDEADWLRERIATSAAGSLLAHLLEPGNRPQNDAPTPWSVSAALAAPEPARTILDHARNFSICMHGAALLYNLLLAEKYEDAGRDAIEPPDYRDALADWADEMTTVGPWDRAGMWALLRNRATSASARVFIDAWTGLVLDGRTAGAADDRALRDLVAGREMAVKQKQSRLMNQKLLRSWTGASGSRQLVYRWPQVRRMLIDIHDGMEAIDAAAA
nr:DUF6361 family protein [Dactylosporangium thailandense]